MSLYFFSNVETFLGSKELHNSHETVFDLINAIFFFFTVVR